MNARIAAVTTALSAQWIDAEHSDAQPARRLTLPGPGQPLAHAWHYWSRTAASLLGRHQLRTAAVGRYQASFTLTPRLQEQWAQLFGLRHGPSGAEYPFFHAHGVGTLLQAQVFADLGINVRHLQHLRHRTRLLAPVGEFAHATEQQLDCRLHRVVRTGPTEVLVILETVVTEPGGQLLARVEDDFLVRELQVAWAVQAEEDDTLRRAVSRLRRRQPEIDARQSDVRLRQLYIAPNAGRRFGRVTGDRHIAHRSTLGARLCGQRRPFVQAQYLRNLVSRELAEWGVSQQQLQIVFTARAGLGQTLRLLLQGERFELLDDKGRLVAFGKA